MLILSIKTDTIITEIGLYLDNKKVDQIVYEAHRILAETIHLKIDQLLKNNSKELNQLDGIICYKGPGSFTGLRIGLAVANALAYGLNIAIIGDTGSKWHELAINRLINGQNDKIVVPEYGADPHITVQKK